MPGAATPRPQRVKLGHMHRRTAFAAAVAALVVAVVLGVAPAASAAADQHPTNRGWDSGSNRGWGSHDDGGGSNSTD